MALINERRQVVPDDAAAMQPHNEVLTEFGETEPGMARAVDDVVGALKQDMLPSEVQERIFSAMNPALKRALIAQEAGLDVTILTTIKDQLRLVDAVLRRTFNEDGTIKVLDEDDIGMNPKDVLNLSLKVSQMMIRDLPKIYSVERMQKMEQAILATIQRHLTVDQQKTFISELEKSNQKI